MPSKERSLQQPVKLPIVENGQHLCVDCHDDISKLRSDALRCETCRAAQARERASIHYYQNRPQKLEYMKKRRQDPLVQQMNRASTERNRKKRNERARGRHRAKVGYNPESRPPCKGCGGVIPAKRGHRAKRCYACSNPPARECTFCHADIANRGARAKYCEDNCRRLHYQSMELQGYTKACTRCKETKEHTEFGFHSGLRRSVCKVCEVEGQSERYYNFTPEQRVKRLSLRRTREEFKRVNRTPEEKEQLRAKRRKAHLQWRFGSEFDVDVWYSEQDGKCAICGDPKSLEELEVDHLHGTRKVRGLLCKNCNLNLLPRYERFPLQHRDSPRLNAYLGRSKSP